jgi:lysophospholipase L1-like esterase
MSQDERELGQDVPHPRTLSRRELLGVLGTAAAASLVGRSAAGVEPVVVGGEQPNAFRVVALGDSAMWGQGLDDHQKYYRLAGERIARTLGKTATFRNLARSGAMIAEPERRDHRSGLPPSGPAGYVDQYPALFPDADARARFIAGDAVAAYRLYRDLPATYPTISQQVDMVDDAMARSADLLLLNGGINDLDKVLVLNPDGYSLTEMENAVEFAFYTRVKSLLAAARQKFPRAVIVVPAYFPVLSDKSDIRPLKRFIEFIAVHLEHQASWVVASNHYMNFMTGWLPGPALLKDIEKTAIFMVARVKFAYNLGHYYQRKAVAEAHADAQVRGPGIFFAHPRFSQENAMYANGTPMFWEAFDPARDPQHDDRLRECPRLDQEKVITETTYAIQNAVIRQQAAPLPQIRRALEVLDGPTSLRRTLTEITASSPGLSRRKAELALEALEALRAEMARIALVKFASYLHPNPAGAARYAEAITRTYRQSSDTRLERHLERLEPNPQRRASVTALLRRYGLDPNAPPEVTWQYMMVDSIGLRVETLRNSTLGAGFKAWLHTQGGQEWRLWNVYMNRLYSVENDLRPGHTALFTIDPARDLHLSELRGLNLRYEGRSGSTWRVGAVELLVNGRLVFTRQAPITLRGGESIALGYAV